MITIEGLNCGNQEALWIPLGGCNEAVRVSHTYVNAPHR